MTKEPTPEEKLQWMETELKVKANEIEQKELEVDKRDAESKEKFDLVDRAVIFEGLFEAFNKFYSSYVAIIGNDNGFIETFEHFVAARRQVHRNTGGNV